MGRIIFLTNMERQHLMLEKARAGVVLAGMQADGRMVLLSDAVPWGTEWQKTFKASDIVIFTWMGSGLDTAFLKKSAAFLRKQKITHAMLISDPDAGELSYGVSPQDKEQLQKYLSYGGVENFHQFWRWLARTYCREAIPVQEPEPLPWHGIYHPRTQGPFTGLAEYRAAFCRSDRPTIGLLLYR